MTLQELLTGVLRQLDRGTDAQTVEAWRDKLSVYINDAIVDLAGEFRPRRTDSVQVQDGRIDLSALPRPCIKVVSLTAGQTRWPFYYGADSKALRVPGVKDGEATLCYRYVPPRLSADTDVPELPEWSHSLLILYAAGRERAAGDAASMSAARACFELYHSAKRAIAGDVGEADAYAFTRRYE